MEYRMIFAGFGGQGVLLAGQLLAEAAMQQDKNVTWMPSYGPEMRGGVAKCSVVLSDDIIGSPIILDPNLLVVMNKPSLDNLSDSVVNNGYIIYNSSLIKDFKKRDDVTYIALPCNDIASEIGSPKAINMPILGAVTKLTKMFEKDAIIKAMQAKFKGKKESIIENNIKAIEKGIEVVSNI